MLLTVDNLQKSFGSMTVLRNLSFLVNDNDRVGIVGANGAGKSTLLRILAGEEEADTGAISFSPSVEIGYLPQTTPDFVGRTVDDLILESVGSLRQLEVRMHELEDNMASATGEQFAKLLEEYGNVTSQFEQRGGYSLDHRIDAIMNGLDISYLSRTREVNTLSGGERARVGLTSLLLRSPNILLLDEPTNHLDFASLAWLETYLSQYRGAILVVSHDRHFLNRICTEIFEISEHSHELKKYPGNYDEYKLSKDAEGRRWEEDYRGQQEEIAELRRFVREIARQVGHNRAPRDSEKYGYNARGERAQHAISSNVRKAEERLRRIEANPIPRPPEPIHISPRFDAQPFESAVAVSADHISKSYGERAILCDISFTLARDSRVVLVGPNGSGKTTLLEVIQGLEKPDYGTVSVALGARIGYLSQDSRQLDKNKTVLEAYRGARSGYDDEFVADLLRHGLFRFEDARKKVGELSVGQRRKLEIAMLIAERPNVLLLDEPTNHIGLDVMEAFEGAIVEFEGPVLVISHDRQFIRRFTGELWGLIEGALIQGGTVLRRYVGFI